MNEMEILKELTEGDKFETLLVDWLINKGKLPPDKRDEAITKMLEQGEKIRVVELQSILPRNAVISRAKLRAVLCKGVFNAGEFDVTVSRKSAKKQVTISADIKSIYDQQPKSCTPYDLTVMDAVSTLWSTGNSIMTPEMIYRAMNGYTEQERVSPQAVAAVTKSVDRMRMTYTKINYTNEAEMRRIEADSFILEGYMLLADKVIVTVKGFQKSAFKFHRLSLLHEYSKANNYLLSVPVEVVNTKSAVQSTPEIIVIRSYLIRRIEAMKSDKNNFEGLRVLYETVFQECEININGNNAVKKRYTTYIKRLLDYWVRLGYIKGYSECKKGRLIAGIDFRIK